MSTRVHSMLLKSDIFCLLSSYGCRLVQLLCQWNLRWRGCKACVPVWEVNRPAGPSAASHAKFRLRGSWAAPHTTLTVHNTVVSHSHHREHTPLNTLLKWQPRVDLRGSTLCLFSCICPHPLIQRLMRAWLIRLNCDCSFRPVAASVR